MPIHPPTELPRTPSRTPTPAPPTTSPDDRALLDFIASRDRECPACGYNVRALTTPVCPECSGRLYLAVGSENLAPGPWALALISLLSPPASTA